VRLRPFDTLIVKMVAASSLVIPVMLLKITVVAVALILN
jgi:hypothetical protein